jgi:hypothetical protein
MGDKQERRRWERQESRVVRPFKSAEEYLADCRFRLYADGEFVEGPLVRLEGALQRERLALAVKVPAPPINFADVVGAELREMSLVVSLEDRTFKNSWVIHEKPLLAFTGGVVDLPEVEHRVSWASDTRIHVSVVLAKSRKAQAGLAYRAGSWLAKKTFFLKSPNDSSTFRIVAETEEYFKKRGLPATTTYFVDIQDPDLNQPCENVPQLITVYMHENAYNALARDDDSIIAKALTRNIYVDVVSIILAAGFNAVEGEIAPHSILDVVCNRITKTTGVPLVKLRQFAKDNGGAPLRAVIQADAELTKAVVSAASRRVQ